MIRFTWQPAPSGCEASDFLLVAHVLPNRNEVARAVFQGREVTVSAPPGTYAVQLFARNANGTSAGSESLLVPVNSSETTLDVDRQTVRVTTRSNGTAFVTGIVRNGSNEPRSFVKVTATFRGPTGAFVGSDWTYLNGQARRLSRSGIITDTTLGPGERGCFAMFTDISGSAISTVDFTTTGDVSSMTPLLSSIRIATPPLQSSSTGQLRLDGEVVNRGPVLGYFVQPLLLVRDAAGAVLDCDYTFVDGSDFSTVLRRIDRHGDCPWWVGAFPDLHIGPLQHGRLGRSVGRLE